MKLKTISKVSESPLFATTVFALSLPVNGLAGTRILGGNTTAEVSDAYPNLFAPAGVTFAIWGVIYALLILYCIRLFLSSALVSQTIKYFSLVSALNILWLCAWQYRQLWLSVLIILGMLLTLIKISSLLHQKRLSTLDWLAFKVPFSVYFGWITIATIANITTFLVSINWGGWGISAEVWTIAILIVGAGIGIITSFRRHDWVYLAVFVWAYYGIWVKHTSSSGHDNAYPAIITALIALLAILSCTMLLAAYKWPKGLPRT